MLKSILDLEGVQGLSKNEQEKIHGDGGKPFCTNCGFTAPNIMICFDVMTGVSTTISCFPR